MVVLSTVLYSNDLIIHLCTECCNLSNLYFKVVIGKDYSNCLTIHVFV